MLLFTPGPVAISEEMRTSFSQKMPHHRTKDFENIFQNVRENLKKMIGLEEILLLNSSGTGAMEASVLSLCKQELLFVNAGKFGERFGKIAKAHSIKTHELVYEWDTPAKVDEVLNTLKANPNIDTFCIQVCESSGGLRHPVEKIASTIKEYNKDIFIIVDAITALGVEPLDITHIDALIGGSQKAFMLPPGMSLIALSQKATERIEERNVGFYFNLKSELKNQRNNTTSYTAPILHTLGLERYFELVKNLGGFEILYKETKKVALATQMAIKALDLKIFPKNPSLSMTTIFNEHAKALRKILKEKYKVQFAGGQDVYKDTLIRINHMGIIPLYETCYVLNALELALNDLGLRAFNGIANTTFLKQYYEI
ncbi:pyridoxal-phosphate-dependent aminotransferase family protein [Helicobacter cetorum]|uniref:Putative aminotransferase n=1 Tax=Helicobacter cetorum (strain ATCC BAA-429 / MIT 00-7128) TaxID=182217 RepID=I0EMP6_HELC0|nr:alanine--glyoxylate aminotransferase family protein [Helicobacter cetorum]AFI04215.1 putative aminotransferase [Helicobacter cetorum MIT 00-7128]